jgi:hypothetical protein
MLAFIYVFGICVVAAILFVAVNEIEPDRRLASALRLVIVAVVIWSSNGYEGRSRL